MTVPLEMKGCGPARECGDVRVIVRRAVVAEHFPWRVAENDVEPAGRVPIENFRTECLRPAGNQAGTGWPANDLPFYELYGEKLVAAGHYREVIRYEEHMLPLAQAIRAKAEREERCVGSAF